MIFDEDALASAIASIPQGYNPYEYLLEVFASKTKRTMPMSFFIHCWVNLGIFSLCFLISIAALVGRHVQHALWAFKWRETGRGTILLPNTIVLFSTFSCIFTGVGVFWIVCNATQKLPIAVQILQALLWPALIFLVWVESYGMLAACWITSPTAGVFRYWGDKAWKLNTMFLAFFPIVLVTEIPFYIMASVHYAAAVRHYRAFVASLEYAAYTWTGGAPLELSQLNMPELQAYVDNAVSIGRNIGRGSVVFMVAIILSTLVFFTSGVLYMLLLRQRLRESRSLSSGSGSATKRFDYLAFLRRSYNLMVLEIFTVTFCGCAYAILSGWPGFFWRSLFSNSHSVMVEESVALYLFSFFGTPVNMLVAIRSWRGMMHGKAETPVPSDSDAAFGALSVATQINIHSEKVVQVETIQPEVSRKGSVGGDTLIGSPSSSEKSFWDLDDDEKSLHTVQTLV